MPDWILFLKDFVSNLEILYLVSVNTPQPLYNTIVGVHSISHVSQTVLYPNKNVQIILKNDHLWSFFNINCTFLGFIFEPCYIQNCVIMNHVIKRL